MHAQQARTARVVSWDRHKTIHRFALPHRKHRFLGSDGNLHRNAPKHEKVVCIQQIMRTPLDTQHSKWPRPILEDLARACVSRSVSNYVLCKPVSARVRRATEPPGRAAPRSQARAAPLPAGSLQGALRDAPRLAHDRARREAAHDGAKPHGRSEVANDLGERGASGLDCLSLEGRLLRRSMGLGRKGRDAALELRAERVAPELRHAHGGQGREVH